MGVFLSQLGCVFSPRKSCTYLKAGSAPKKATNVINDTVTVNMIMVRVSVMVKEYQGFQCGAS
jgi:hypothetical protein